MPNPKDFTGRILSEKLLGCGLESEYKYAVKRRLVDRKNAPIVKSKFFTNNEKISNVILDYQFYIPFDSDCFEEHYYAYSYLDVMVKYAKEFFGEEMIAHNWTNLPDEQMAACVLRPIEILSLLQQGKCPDEYIWENCLFNPAKQGFKKVIKEKDVEKDKSFRDGQLDGIKWMQMMLEKYDRSTWRQKIKEKQDQLNKLL